MADISQIQALDGVTYDLKDATARGLVVANPTLAGTEADLTALEVGGTKYKVPSGGSGVSFLTVVDGKVCIVYDDGVSA